MTIAPPRFLQTALRALFGRRSNFEAEMTINRIVIITMLYIAGCLANMVKPTFNLDAITKLYITYLCSAVALVAHVRFRPEGSVVRRAYALSIDIGALSAVAYVLGPTGVGFLYPPFFLIIYGYGFRFGAGWLTGAAAISIVGVAVVIAVSPEWQDSGFMAGGLVMGLILTPAYSLRLVRSLAEAKAQAESSNHAKSMFLASVSHDLRTPLNAIIGLGDILAVSRIPAEEADMARTIGGAGRYLLGQIDSILDLSQLEMGRAGAKLEPVDLFAMLYSVRELLDVSAQAKGIRLSLIVEGGAPRTILSSERYLKDTLINLAGNAIKFTGQGSVEIVLKAVDAGADEKRLRFEVRDTGIGISAASQGRIFERFTQANDKIRDSYGGSGLGLAICKQLVQRLGGEIGVVSSEGRGSVFWFEIDAAAVGSAQTTDAVPAALLRGDDAQLVAAARAAVARVDIASTDEEMVELCRRAEGPRLPPVIVEGAAAAVRLQRLLESEHVAGLRRAGFVVVDCEAGAAELPAVGCIATLPPGFSAEDLAQAVCAVAGPTARASDVVMRTPARAQSILVAEDNKTNQKVIAKMLALSGRRATLVDNGEAALDLLREERFDVVLMDINMPIVDGIEATRRARAFERSLGRRTPIIALTADVTPDTRARCMGAGIDDCVTKPVDLPTLLAAIDRLACAEPSAEIDRAQDVPDEGVPAVPQDDEVQRAEPPPDFNHAALADLEQLGGREFVNEVVAQFVSDAAVLLRELATAVERGDIEKFKDDAHALRSCSANVGASAIYNLCLSWREIGAQEFAREGANHVARLEREFASATAQLEPFIARAA